MNKKRKNEYVIGVDGGATKSIAAICCSCGEVVKVKRGDSFDYYSVGKTESGLRIKAILDEFLKKYNIRVVVLGLAGLNTKKDEAFYKKMVKSVLPEGVKFQIVNDTKIALEAACPDADARLLIISGTGSNIYGEHKRKSIRSGGWDFLLGDEGSGYEFGMKAIRAAIRSYDGREKKTVFEKLVLKRAKVATAPDLINKIYKIWHEKPNELKYYIASFSPVIDEACKKGDRMAKRIIEDGAEELYLGARSVIKKLKMERVPLCVGYVGSNFRAPSFKNILSRKIKKLAPKAYFISGVEPVEGAIKMAIKLVGH